MNTRKEWTPSDIEGFLEDLYADCAAEPVRLDDLSDRVITIIDDLCLDGKFAVLDALLARVEQARIHPWLVGTFLCFTRCAKEKLPSREAFWERALEDRRKADNPMCTVRRIEKLR